MEGECSQDLSFVCPESQPSQEAKAIFQYEFELLDWDLKVNKSCCSGEEAETWPRTPVREQPRDLTPAWKGGLSPLVACTSRPQSWAMKMPLLGQEELGLMSLRLFLESLQEA